MAFTSAVHPVVRPEPWGPLALERPSSPFPCPWLPLSLFVKRSLHSVQWLARLGLTCGCRYASVCQEEQGRLHLPQLILSVPGFHQQEQWVGSS